MRDLVKLVGAAVAGALVAVALTGGAPPAAATDKSPDIKAICAALMAGGGAVAAMDAQDRVAAYFEAKPAMSSADAARFVAKDLGTFVRRQARAEIWEALCR